jgi:hypothetical protein
MQGSHLAIHMEYFINVGQVRKCTNEHAQRMSEQLDTWNYTIG